MSLLEQLGAPSEVWREFLFVCSVPHGSGNVGPLRDAIIKRIEGTGLEYVVEKESGNLLITKKADPGWESAEPICIQAHMDMVCVKEDGSDHDFEKDPIVPRIEGPNLVATGTTLGGDDGIGVAAGLALVLDKSFKSGMIEVLLTVDEETTMHGAENITAGLLKSKTLINADSEDIGVVTIGSSGGFQGVYRPELKTASRDVSSVTVTISDLTSGHSGVEIHKSRANAIKLSARMLDVCFKNGFGLVGMTCGSFFNVIPKFSEFSVAGGDSKKLSAELTEMAEVLKAEFATTDPLMQVQVVEKAPAAVQVAFPEDTRRFIDFLYTCPTGVLRMSPDVPGLVETSINLAFVKPVEEAGKLKFEVGFLARSSQNSALPAVATRMDAIARVTGYSLENYIAPYCGWKPNPKSPLLARVLTAAREVTGSEWRYEAIHAGLECGMFFEKYPDMDAVSIGPTIANAHTVKELLEIETVLPFYEIIKLVVTQMK